MFSLHAAVAVFTSYNMGDNAIVSALRALKDAGKIRADGYVLQSDVDAMVKEFAL